MQHSTRRRNFVHLWVARPGVPSNARRLMASRFWLTVQSWPARESRVERVCFMPGPPVLCTYDAAGLYPFATARTALVTASWARRFR